MARAQTTTTDLKIAVCEAVAVLDEADGSRTGMQEAIDSARETLSDAYGANFDEDVSEYYSSSDDEEIDDDEEIEEE